MQPMPDHSQHRPEITGQMLRKATHGFSSTFVLSLPKQVSLICEEVIRLVPGKRLVAFGLWKKKQIVAKIFFNARAKQHMAREIRGIEALTTAKIPSPAILFYGQSIDPSISVLIFERIAQAESLDTFCQKHKNSPKTEAMLTHLTIELATQHVLGLIQEDLHLNNFLIAADKIYTLDGANIRKLDKPLDKKQSLENLALFFSQLGISTNTLQQCLFHTYIKTRSWVIKKADLQFFQRALLQWNIKRWVAYRKKIFRSSTQFCRIKNFQHFILYERHYDSPLFEQLIQNPDAFFSLPSTEILKAGRTSTVVKIPLDNQQIVIKRYNIKNFHHRLKRCIQPTRAQLSWRLAHQLQFVGINTAKPVAFIENRFLGLRSKSYFVMEYIEGTRADHFFENTTITPEQKIIAAKRIVALLFKLVRLRLSHGDLKITNILFNTQQEPILIDLDSMREHRSSLSLWYYFRKDLVRFLENWQNNPTMQQLFKQLIQNKKS